MVFSDRSEKVIVHGREKPIDYLLYNMLHQPITIQDFIMRYNNELLLLLYVMLAVWNALLDFNALLQIFLTYLQIFLIHLVIFIDKFQIFLIHV